MKTQEGIPQEDATQDTRLDIFLISHQEEKTRRAISLSKRKEDKTRKTKTREMVYL